MMPLLKGLHIGAGYGTSINELLVIIEDLVKLLKKIEDRWVDIESGVSIGVGTRKLCRLQPPNILLCIKELTVIKDWYLTNY